MDGNPIAEPELVTFRCAGVEIRRGGRPVLCDVDWTVEQGQFWFVLGTNGSGKSTLLQTVLGRLRPTKGQLERAGEANGAIGYVPQRCSMDPSLPTTTFEFVDLGLVGLGLSRMERRARTEAALAAVDVEAGSHRSLWSHSDGQLQRVLLARAFARRPRLMVLDEPTSALDPRASKRFWKRLARLQKENQLTVICASHDVPAAARHASHIAVCMPLDLASRASTLASGPTARVLADGIVDAVLGTGVVPRGGSPG